MKSSPTYYFLHIPKTAGTSFTHILHRQFYETEICPAYLWRDLLRLPENSLHNYRLFRGHFYGYLNRVVKQPLNYLTFLRDPLERSLSHYAHIRREPGHYFHQKVHELGGLQELLADPSTSPMITNFQTRSLALNLDPVGVFKRLTEADVQAHKLEETLESVMSDDSSEDELLAKAKAKLDECFFVGLAERFEESLAVLAALTQWELPLETSRLNQSPERLLVSQLPPELLNELNKHTRLDQELYRYAQRKFAEQKLSIDVAQP